MPDKSQSILLGGAAIGIAAAMINLIPTIGGCIACLLYIAAGVVAVWHYTDRHQLTVKGGQGAGLGALAGLVAGAVAFVIQLLFQVIGLTPSWRVQMEQQFERSGMDPAQIEEILQTLSSPLVMVGIILAGLVVDAVLGAIGGAIGASMFKRESGAAPAREDVL